MAKRIFEVFRVDIVWPIGGTQDVTSFPGRFPHLLNPFFDNSLIAGKLALLLDIQNTLVVMSAHDEIRAIRESGFRVYSWDGDVQDPLADLFLIQLGTHPEPEEIGIDYKDLIAHTFHPEKFPLRPARALAEDIVEHPTISYLPRHRMKRCHYAMAASRDYPGFYVGNVGDFDDLVTYWNLRAADIPLWFVDPNHMDRYSNLIPAWEKYGKRIIARSQDDRNYIAVWARNYDHQAARQLFAGGHHVFCPINDYAGVVDAPMMYFGETEVLGTVSHSGSQTRVVSARR